MPQNVLTALNMILQSREQRERADVSAALQGMEMSLREKEMASFALDRAERRQLQRDQHKLAKDEYGLREDEHDLRKEKAFQEKLTKIQMNETQNLHHGAAVMFDTMFSTLFRNNTTGGVNFKESNFNSLVNDLTGKNYAFSKLDAERIAGGIMSYGIGKDKPNALAMAELARFMKERYMTDKKFVQSLVRGGMVADPRANPESAKAWLSNMEGLVRSQSNIHSLQKEWHDFTDDDATNDLTMRKLEGMYDFSTKPGQKTGTGGGGGFNIGANLMQLKAETDAIAQFNKERDAITANTTLTQTERDKALDKLKYSAYKADPKDPKKQIQIPSSYQTLMGDYDVDEGYFGGGVQGGELIDKNIYMGSDVYALKEPEAAVDAIADRRDQLQDEKKDAMAELKGLQRLIQKSESIPFDQLSDENKMRVGEAKVKLFREEERVTAIDDAISKFYLQADIETEKYIEDSWWGAGNEARNFRTGSLGVTSFPYELLTRTEQEKLDKQRKAMKQLGQSPGIMYK